MNAMSKCRGLVGLVVALSAGVCWPDIVTLQDGTILTCEVIGEREVNNERFMEIDIGGSRLLLRADLIAKREERKVPDLQASEREVMGELLRQGKLLPSLRSQFGLNEAAAGKPESSELRIGEIKGWAYTTEILRGQPILGQPLAKNDLAPIGIPVQVMPNSRLREDFGQAASIFLPAGARLMVSQCVFDSGVFTYRLTFDITQRYLALRVNELVPPRKLRVTTGGVYFFSTGGLVGIEKGLDGKIRFVPLDKPVTLSASLSAPGRHETINPGQMFISEGDGKGSIEPVDTQPMLALVEGWDAWQPQTLNLDWRVPLPGLPLGDAWPPEPMILPAQIEPIPELIQQFPMQTMGENQKAWREGLEAFRRDVGRYPSKDEGLKVLRINLGQAGWKGPYVETNLSDRDVWGNEFIYDLIQDGETEYSDVRSMGPDGQDDVGLDDDLR